MKEQLRTFKENLENFLETHKKKINKDPRLRQEFFTMCRELGIDPLSSSQSYLSGYLSSDFYYELAVQIITVCIGLRPRNGGILEVSDCIKWLNQLRGTRAAPVAAKDVLNSISSLSVLGHGFSVIKLGEGQFIASVPLELNTDHQLLLNKATGTGYVNRAMLHDWSDLRFQTAVDKLLGEGLAWLDDGPEGKWYWVPALAHFLNE
mmetsp:Transcript_34105/g.59483  ORF Transcript_34105/g.59483 Transcript_34105/m.59483 type:complete len:206 (-) Transcript_34105:4005-4622(-)